MTEGDLANRYRQLLRRLGHPEERIERILRTYDDLTLEPSLTMSPAAARMAEKGDTA